MKKLLLALVFSLLTLTPCFAQQGVHSRRFTIAGPDSAISLKNTAIAWHQLTWNDIGTVSACTVALDTSADGITWSAGGAITGQTCTSNGASSIVNVVANFVRINMTALTVTAGGSVTVTWDGYTNNPSSGSITGSGTAGQVTFWSSPSVITGNADLTWDNTNHRFVSVDGCSSTPVTLFYSCSLVTSPTHGSFVFVSGSSPVGAVSQIESFVPSGFPGPQLVLSTLGDSQDRTMLMSFPGTGHGFTLTTTVNNAADKGMSLDLVSDPSDPTMQDVWLSAFDGSGLETFSKPATPSTLQLLAGDGNSPQLVSVPEMFMSQGTNRTDFTLINSSNVRSTAGVRLHHDTGQIDAVLPDAGGDVLNSTILTGPAGNSFLIDMETAGSVLLTNTPDGVIFSDIHFTATGEIDLDPQSGQSVVASGPISATAYGTATNCSSSASPAVCGSAPAGSVAIPTGTTSSTLQVNTTAVTANSQIVFYPDDTLGTKLGSITCNNTLATLAGGSFISARTPGVSFTITFNGSILTNKVCGSYVIIN